MIPFWVYILRCSDDSFYVGHTDDLEVRFAQHQSGVCGGYTAERLPVELAWASEMPTRDEAIQREMQIKNWSRAKKIALIRGDWRGVRMAARGSDRWP